MLLEDLYDDFSDVTNDKMAFVEAFMFEDIFEKFKETE